MIVVISNESCIGIADASTVSEGALIVLLSCILFGEQKAEVQS